MKKLRHSVLLAASQGILEVKEVRQTQDGEILNEKELTDLGVMAIQAVHRYWGYSPAAPRTAVYWVGVSGTIDYHPAPSRDDEPYPVITLDTPFPSIGYSK